MLMAALNDDVLRRYVNIKPVLGFVRLVNFDKFALWITLRRAFKIGKQSFVDNYVKEIKIGLQITHRKHPNIGTLGGR
jgi:c-di-AMP phosphodiesterase-like protein